MLAICLTLFEDTWVAKIVAKFPNQAKKEDNVEEAGSEKVKKDKNKISSDLVCKKGNNETESDLQEE